MSERFCKYPGCDEVATAGRFGSTYCEAHNEQVKAEKAASAPSRPRTSTVGLESQLKDAAFTMSLGVLMASGNTEILAGPAGELVVNALEERSAKFAKAWMDVARQNKRVEVAIRQIVTGGVWVQAAVQTAAFGVTTMTIATRKAVVPPVILTRLCPELAPLIVAQPQYPPTEPVYGPEQEPSQNGAGEGAQEPVHPWPPREDVA